jgi:hypothetical protein
MVAISAEVLAQREQWIVLVFVHLAARFTVSFCFRFPNSFSFEGPLWRH